MPDAPCHTTSRAITTGHVPLEAAPAADVWHLVDLAIGRVCSRRGVRGDQRDEFRSHVYERLLERDGRLLRAYRGEGDLGGYLGVVVSRLWLDHLIARRGKWRPSSAARRAGDQAVTLERLLTRDQLTLEEAARTLQARDATLSDRTIDLWRHQIRTRPVRPAPADLDLDLLPSPAPSPEAQLLERCRRERDAQVRRCLMLAARQLSPRMRWSLRLRFVEGMPLNRIASAVGEPVPAFYRTFARALKSLRTHLVDAGVAAGRPVARRHPAIPPRVATPLVPCGTGRALPPAATRQPSRRCFPTRAAQV